MPIYKKGKKHRVVIWHKGTRHDFVLSGTKEEARAFEAVKRVEIQSTDPEAMKRAVPGFSAFAEGAYRTHAKAHLKKRTWTNRTYTIATLSDCFHNTKLCDIHAGDVERYKLKRLKKGIRASTINDELKVLRAILSYARALSIPTAPNLKPRNLPTHGVKRKVTFWTEAQLNALYASVQKRSPDIMPIVVFLVNTGCRRGEALALEWRNVDLERKMIRIEPSEDWQPKDGEPREIPISAGLLPWLSGKHVSKRWVFPNRRKKRFAFWPQRAFDRAREKAKLVGGPHTTRHTFATHFLAKCPDLFLLARLLGHSHAYVTELYSHLLPDHLERARNVVSFGAGLVEVDAKKKAN